MQLKRNQLSNLQGKELMYATLKGQSVVTAGKYVVSIPTEQEKYKLEEMLRMKKNLTTNQAR